MTDSLGAPPGPDLPDFLDRLLARHRPAAPARPDVVRVRPRLAGPFERVEAVRGTQGNLDEGEPLWPAAPQPAVREGELSPAAREVRMRTEREHTVVRTERDPAPEPSGPRPVEPQLPQAPLLRPTTTVAPDPRPAPAPVRRSGDRTADARPARPEAAAALRPPAADAASAAVSPLRPSAADTAAAREASRQSSGRRAAQPAEQVVQVQIGRLEVSAAPAPGAARRPAAPERSGATVSLADYLARGRE